jgi:hypothetical protein
MNYYNAFTSPYHHRLEEKSIDNIGSSLNSFQSMKNNLKELVFPRENQLDKHTCLPSYN